MKMYHRSFSISIARGGVMLSAVVLASWAHTAQAGNGIWTTRGPAGADVYALAIDPTAPETVYVGTASNADSTLCCGGVFKSINGGSTWGGINRGLPSTDVNVLAVDPHSPSTLYAGTVNRGVFKTVDSGATWSASNTGLPGGTLTVYEVRVDPAAPDTIYAGTDSHGVFKSTTGGSNWLAANTGLETASVIELAIDPNAPDTLLAATSAGIFKTTDGAQTWKLVLFPGVVFLTIEIDPLTPTTVYAGSFDRGVYKSTDSGSTWHPKSSGITDSNIRTLAIDPETSGTAYAGTYNQGVFKTTDGGQHWAAANAGLQTMHFLTSITVYWMVLDHATPRTLYAGTPDGVFKSTDGGDTWVSLGVSVTGGIVSLASDPNNPDTVYAGAQSGGVFMSMDGGSTWGGSMWGTNNPGSNFDAVRSLAIDPTSPHTVYAGKSSSGVFKSVDGGSNWIAVNTNLTDLNIQSLAIDPTGVLYVGTERSGVFKSTNGGDSWDQANADLTVAYVSAITIDPTIPLTLYAAAYTDGNDFGVLKSTDGAATWKSIGGAGYQGIGSLAIDPSAPQTIYAGTGGNGIFKSVNGGEAWASVTMGFLAVNALVVDSATPQTVYAGTSNRGVLRSTDGGGTWDDFNPGLPNEAAVNALLIAPGTSPILHAGTGIGVFSIQEGVACIGDCDASERVGVDELVKGVNIALGNGTLEQCESFDCNASGHVTVDCLVKAVNNALSGCEVPSPPPTATPIPTPVPCGGRVFEGGCGF